ncbi:MAG TPA: DMT family transporter [Candidatus Methanomethylicus sp.]|nr:DMT family transporter [Candidatus Methanomethylicus sp.]
MTHHWGYLGATAAAMLFGISSTFNKIALASVPPLLIAGMIYAIGGILLLAFRISPLNELIINLLATPTQTEGRITGNDYRVLAFIIMCGSILAPILQLYGLNQSTAVNASLLLNAEVLFTVLIALAFWKERGSIKDYLAVCTILVGVALLTTNGQLQDLSFDGIAGNLLIVGACLFWGIDNNLSKKLSKKRDLLLVTGLKCLIGGAALLFMAYMVNGGLCFPLDALPYLLSVGALSIALSILFFTFALREIGAMRTGVVYSLSALFGAVLAFLVLGEPFSLIQLLAGLMMIIGVYLLYRR